MGGLARWSPVLVQRAVSEDPRWTRAVGDHLAALKGEGRTCAFEDRPGEPLNRWASTGGTHPDHPAHLAAPSSSLL